MFRGSNALRRSLLRAVVAALGVAAVASGAACSGDGGGERIPGASSTAPAAARTPAPVTLRGQLMLDGAPVESKFLGVRVVRDGLAAACQRTIPAVSAGAYEIGVLSDGEMRGCGAPGADMLLWIYAHDTFYFSRETLPWPAQGGAATFDASFSSGATAGASRRVTEFKGHLFNRDGTPLPSATVIEAYADEVRCGLASLRARDENERYYTLIVSGPDSVSGCAEDATLTFRLDGKPAAQTASNNLGGDAEGQELDLTLR